MDEDSSERGIHSRASDREGSGGAPRPHPPTLKLNTKRRRRIYMGIGAGVLVLVVVGIVSASRSKGEIDPSKLGSVERGDIARAVVATGKIQPLTKVEVKSKASGIVKKIYADYGDHVRDGQVLVELDKEELQARVREAGAALLSAQAALERTKVEAQGPDIPYLKAAVDRARNLFQQGLIATNVREEAESAYELALNKQRAARITVESFKDKKFDGRVTKISPLGKEKDNVTTFEVKVSIDNATGELKANMSANAEIIREEKKAVLLMPESAVVYDKDRKTFAEVPDAHGENGRRKVAIKTGISNGVKTEVLEGLNEGAKVVLQ